MRQDDILRVLVELDVFQLGDMERALDLHKSTCSHHSQILENRRLIERVRVGKDTLYAVTERGRRRVASLPAIDPEERCLLLVHLSVTERYMHHNDTPVLDTSEDDVPVIFEECRVCKRLYCDLGDGFVCDTCRRMGEF